MAQAAVARTKINTELTQIDRGSGHPARPRTAPRPPKGPRVRGDARERARHTGRPVIELDLGILVYPPETDGEPWRATFTENGQRRFRQGAAEARLAAKLEKATERLSGGAANMERPGRDLIAYYRAPDRLPVEQRWLRKHAHTQRRLCERFAAPVIDAVTCQDIKTGHMQQIVNAAPTAGEGDRVQGMISALVSAGLDGGYLANPQLAKVHSGSATSPSCCPSHSRHSSSSSPPARHAQPRCSASPPNSPQPSGPDARQQHQRRCRLAGSLRRRLGHLRGRLQPPPARPGRRR
jgi:hypothetical protein